MHTGLPISGSARHSLALFLILIPGIAALCLNVSAGSPCPEAFSTRPIPACCSRRSHGQHLADVNHCVPIQRSLRSVQEVHPPKATSRRPHLNRSIKTEEGRRRYEMNTGLPIRTSIFARYLASRSSPIAQLPRKRSPSDRGRRNRPSINAPMRTFGVEC
jgi:hypothetical protein